MRIRWRPINIHVLNPHKAFEARSLGRAVVRRAPTAADADLVARCVVTAGVIARRDLFRVFAMELGITRLLKSEALMYSGTQYQKRMRTKSAKALNACCASAVTRHFASMMWSRPINRNRNDPGPARLGGPTWTANTSRTPSSAP